MDGDSVVFGQVIKGRDVIRKLLGRITAKKILRGYEALIADCGEVSPYAPMHKKINNEIIHKLTTERVLRIGTFNIQSTTDRYMERRDLLKQVLKDMDFDILCV